MLRPPVRLLDTISTYLRPLKISVFVLVILAVLMAIGGLLGFTDRIHYLPLRWGLPLIGVSCLMGIIARILQSQYQHWELLWMVDTQVGDDEIDTVLK